VNRDLRETDKFLLLISTLRFADYLGYSPGQNHEDGEDLGMPMFFRTLSLSVMLATTTVGCTHYGVSGPEDLGLAAKFDPQLLPTTLTPGDPNPKLSRNEVLSKWLIRSDYLCADYQLQLSRSIRDTRLATDFLATVLAGLATIFAQPAVTRPLAGSATIALGVGGDIQSDLFLQQAGDVVGTAIQAVRTRARTELQKKFTAEYADYTLEQGFVDVQRYDRETCNLNVGLNEIRASLNIVGPVAPQANDPIVPLPQPPTGTGAGPSLAGATSGATPPLVTTTIPPIVQPTSQGGFVFTPGKVVTTPAVAPPPPAAGPPPAPGGAAAGTGAGPSPSAPRIIFRRTTPPRSDLFRALLSDPEGKRPFDPDRVKMMRECWTELQLTPAPTDIASWLQQGTNQSFAAVAACINGKAATKTPGRVGASIPVVPTSSARSELFLALLSDAEGSRPFDAARVKLMRECWNDLQLAPAPQDVATWLRQATDETFRAVASCINRKATARTQ
jgi:hypothetical protein